MIIDNMITVGMIALNQRAMLPEVLLYWCANLCTWKSMYPTTNFIHSHEFCKEADLTQHNWTEAGDKSSFTFIQQVV